MGSDDEKRAPLHLIRDIITEEDPEHSCVGEDGAVIVEWIQDRRRVGVVFEADGSVCWVCVDMDGPTIGASGYARPSQPPTNPSPVGVDPVERPKVGDDAVIFAVMDAHLPVMKETQEAYIAGYEAGQFDFTSPARVPDWDGTDDYVLKQQVESKRPICGECKQGIAELPHVCEPESLQAENARLREMLEGSRWRLWNAMRLAQSMKETVVAGMVLEREYRRRYGDHVPWSAGAPKGEV